MHLDPETASLLGWDEIKKVLAGLTRTPYGARRCLALRPSADLDRIRQAQARHAQLAWLLDQSSQPPIIPKPQFVPPTPENQKGSVPFNK